MPALSTAGLGIDCGRSSLGCFAGQGSKQAALLTEVGKYQRGCDELSTTKSMTPSVLMKQAIHKKRGRSVSSCQKDSLLTLSYFFPDTDRFTFSGSDVFSVEGLRPHKWKEVSLITGLDICTLMPLTAFE